MLLCKYELLSREFINKEKKRGKELMENSQIGKLVNVICEGLCYLYLEFQILISSISIGDFSALIQATNTFNNSLTDVVINTIKIFKNAVYLNEYILFMKIDITQNRNHHVILRNHSPQIIEFKNVSFKYPNANEYILKNINIKISAGERLAIVGKNGAGKTTFIKLLSRLYDVTEGEILLDGININQYSYAQYYELLSIVFQDYNLLAFSIYENICMKRYDERFEKKILSLCEAAGLAKKINELPRGICSALYKYYESDGIELSGGESQKLAIVRALYKESPIIILDEPTAALDPVAEYDIYRHFQQMIGNRTAIYISHRLSACKFCDRIAVIEDGKIIEIGSHEKLLMNENGIYSKMYKTQATYYNI